MVKKMTRGDILAMGRRTVESPVRPLSGRKNLIRARRPQRLTKSHPELFGRHHEWRGGLYPKRACQFHFTRLEKNQRTEILIFNSLDRLNPWEFLNDIFNCGGDQMYERVQLHLSHEPRPLSQMKLNPALKNIPDFKSVDSELERCVPYPAFERPVKV